MLPVFSRKETDQKSTVCPEKLAQKDLVLLHPSWMYTLVPPIYVKGLLAFLPELRRSKDTVKFVELDSGSLLLNSFPLFCSSSPRGHKDCKD